MYDTIISTTEGYNIGYSGGRLADVLVNGHAIECVQVRDYDFATGEFGAYPSAAQIQERVREFIEEAGGFDLYVENIVQYLPGPPVERDPYAPCGYCRRCAIHDDPGGCLTVEAYVREHGEPTWAA